MADTNANQNQPIRTYGKQFAGLIATVFAAKSAFAPTFGTLQALDGVQQKDIAFSVKTSDVPLVVGAEYDTDANTAFGDGTANSSRFGKMTEVTYQDHDVPYDWGYVIHEGIDRYTVNNDPTAAVADRLALQAEAKVRQMNNKLGAYLVASASEDLGEATNVNDLFKKADAKYTNLEVTVKIRAYVTAEVFNEILDDPHVTTAKNSGANIDENTIGDFRGFIVSKTPDKYLQGKAVIFAPDNIGRAFTGIVTARTIEAVDFDGQEIQAAAKAGQFISDDNKKAIFTASTAPKA